MAVVLAFGDSITYGSWDIQESGWVERLRKHLDQKMVENPENLYLLYNLGISGETTEGLLKRFKNEVESRAREGHDFIFIFAFGANDLAWIPSKNKYRVDVENYIKNFQVVIEQAKSFTNKVLVLNITPVVDELTRNSDGKDKSRENKSIDLYNGKLSTFAESHNLAVIDINSAFKESGYTGLLSEDGLHPNNKGHQIIYGLVWDSIVKLL